ncbi:helix-turn-helix transcriptional regulator [Vibrio parahaemolyticus]|uniref:helix-turn-helix transcriptional regulator n=1 Tax=Vibrio parahaemolyticus TaxID=670 RepID=UPI003891B916|nr:AlpA family phage regulatory protein [Vibrio parahaemolyticus]
MKNQIKLERKKQVLDRIPFSKATLHRYINLGKFPPSIPLGSRSVCFLSHEIDAFIVALAADKDLETLVEELIAQRKDLASTSIFKHKFILSSDTQSSSKENA